MLKASDRISGIITSGYLYTLSEVKHELSPLFKGTSHWWTKIHVSEGAGGMTHFMLVPSVSLIQLKCQDSLLSLHTDVSLVNKPWNSASQPLHHNVMKIWLKLFEVVQILTFLWPPEYSNQNFQKAVPKLHRYCYICQSPPVTWQSFIKHGKISSFSTIPLPHG